MTRFRYVVIALLWTVTLVNYFDRGAIAYAIGPLRQYLGISNTGFGLIGGGFGAGYLAGSLALGRLVDRYNVKKIMGWAVAAWSVAIALTGLASGFWGLLGCRILLGLAEAVHFPALLRISTDWLPTSERARGLSACLMGVPFASVLAAPFLGTIIDALGWRAMFFSLGTLGALWLVPFLLLFTDSPKDSSFVSSAELKHIGPLPLSSRDRRAKTPWKLLLTSPTLLSNYFAFFTFGYTIYFSLIWLPGYLEQTYGLALSAVRWIAMVPWLAAALFLLAGGILSDRIYARTGSVRASRSYVICGSQLASALCFLPVIFVDSLGAAVVFFSLGLGFAAMLNAPIYAIQSDLAQSSVGATQGVMSSFFSLAGIAAPALTGFITQETGNFHAAVAVLLCLSLLSSLCVFLFQHPDRASLK